MKNFQDYFDLLNHIYVTFRLIMEGIYGLALDFEKN